MYRIRFHGRGGQGMKTAGRILGSAFFNDGFNIQDAPRYGAERRGAPIFSYVRASRRPIYERGIIVHPDLIIVADETLFTLPAPGIVDGAELSTVFFIVSDQDAEHWKNQIPTAAAIITLPWSVLKQSQNGLPLLSPACAAAAACLCGLPETSVLQAMTDELPGRNQAIITENQNTAKRVYAHLKQRFNIVTQGQCSAVTKRPEPDWIDLPFDPADLSAPSIHAACTSRNLHTGTWRTQRPVIDLERCTRCGLCNIFCPDGAIIPDQEGIPHIQLDHCKGCLICKTQCPVKAIDLQAEHGEPVKRKDQGRTS